MCDCGERQWFSRGDVGNGYGCGTCCQRRERRNGDPCAVMIACVMASEALLPSLSRRKPIMESLTR